MKIQYLGFIPIILVWFWAWIPIRIGSLYDNGEIFRGTARIALTFLAVMGGLFWAFS